jgi:PAS domain S-box-containing protein
MIGRWLRTLFPLPSRPRNASLQMDCANIEQFRLLLDGITDYASFLLDPGGAVSCWTNGAEKMFGYTSEEITGKHFAIFYPAGERDSYQPAKELQMAGVHGRFEDTSWRMRRDGSTFWAESVICPIREENGELHGFSQIIRDITERKKSEEALREKEEELAQARKMEAIGRLAGGVAHDFNNFVTGIIGLADDVRQTMDRGDTRRDDLEEIIKTAERARVLTRELLAFGRRQTSSPAVLHLNSVIEEKKKILSHWMGADIAFTTRLDPSAGNVLIDPTQLDQILVNLIMNARDAMMKGGRVAIETQRIVLDGAKNPGLRPGAYAALIITDTGCGMDQNVLTHLFEPFFTTKKVGKGTGLGLATVYGIIKQNHGDISVESELEKGSRFRVLLPEVNSPVKSKEAARPAPEPPARASETVLVVEDEDVVRIVVRRALEKFGYRVLFASSGPAALEMAAKFTGRIHLLLTDVVMPEMNGRVLADRFSASHPEAAVLYMSAYSEDVIHQRGILEPGLAFIEKPFTKETLAIKVSEALQKRRPALPR